jgi:cytoskeletal protein RodZ
MVMKYKWHIASGLVITGLIAGGVILGQPKPKPPTVNFKQTADTSQATTPATTSTTTPTNTDTTTSTAPTTTSTSSSSTTPTTTADPSPAPSPAPVTCPSGTIALSADNTACQPDCTYVDNQMIAAGEVYWNNRDDLSGYTTAAEAANALNTQYACNIPPLPIPPFAPSVFPPLPPLNQ